MEGMPYRSTKLAARARAQPGTVPHEAGVDRAGPRGMANPWHPHDV
jgi:hypothetical protein